jgi:hypothetical protein
VFVVNNKGSETPEKFLLLATYCGIFFTWDFMSPDHTSLSLSAQDLLKSMVARSSFYA